MNIPVNGIARCIVALCLLTGLDVKAQDVYLRCKGSLTLYTSDLPLVNDNQQIAVHIQTGTMVYVSGNPFIENTVAPICPDRSPTPDELRFDSRSCSDRAPHGGIYGSYNRILKKVDISDDRRYGQRWLASGVFTCLPVQLSN